MKMREPSERRITKIVTAQGSERLLNGFVARLSFVAIKYFQSKKQNCRTKGHEGSIHASIKRAHPAGTSVPFRLTRRSEPHVSEKSEIEGQVGRKNYKPRRG